MIPKYQDIVDLIKKGATVEAQEKIMELRESVINAQEEIQNLRSQVEELKTQLSVKAQVQYEKPYYWEMKGEQRDGPYCQVCYDKDQKLIRLQETRQGLWHCGCCKKYFRDSTYRAPEVIQGNPGEGSWRI